jgi:hypothetical protein
VLGDWVGAEVGDWDGQCTATGLEPRSAMDGAVLGDWAGAEVGDWDGAR